jgi:MraZ protein
MFAGEYLCKVDEKGRFIVPSPIREQVDSEGQAVVFLKGPEESILIYSMKEWEKVLERTKTTLDEEQSRLFMHFVVSEAGTSELDKAGRILIPGKLRKLVPLDDDQEIILVGLYHRLESQRMAPLHRSLRRSL